MVCYRFIGPVVAAAVFQRNPAHGNLQFHLRPHPARQHEQAPDSDDPQVFCLRSLEFQLFSSILLGIRLSPQNDPPALRPDAPRQSGVPAGALISVRKVRLFAIRIVKGEANPGERSACS